jgi:hypothetical protein
MTRERLATIIGGFPIYGEDGADHHHYRSVQIEEIARQFRLTEPTPKDDGTTEAMVNHIIDGMPDNLLTDEQAIELARQAVREAYRKRQPFTPDSRSVQS